MLRHLRSHRKPRLVLLILIMASLSLALKAESKNRTQDLNKRITLLIDNAPLKNALDIIAKKGGVSIIYSNSKELTSTIVSINVKDKRLVDVFQDLLTPLPFAFKVIDDKIVISFDPLKKHTPPTKQNKVLIDIRGKVVDKEGIPLIGATVKVKDGTQAIATNNDGTFVLHNIQEGTTIIISNVGYVSKEIVAASDLGIIILDLNPAKLNEVKINAGYYSVTDRERTGAITKVSAATIGENPVNNPLLALQGRVPGLQVTQTTGIPGGGISVQIRGQNSIKNGNDPLYIIDGVTYPSTRISGESTSTLLGKVGANNGASPLSMIDPDEIESIEVLKDADATAIYGSRGANGVILITTKKGKAGDTKVTASISQGFSQVAHRINLMNTDQYLSMRREALKNDGLTPLSTDYDLNGTWDQTKNIDWQKELIGGTAHNTNASLNLTGGTAKSNYLIAGNYDQEGTVFPGDYGFKRIGVRSNINLGSSDDRLNTNFTINYSHTESDLFASNIVTNIFLPPNQPDPYNAYGKLNWGNGTTNTVYTNPMAAMLQTSNAGTDNLIADLTFNYRIIKDLYFKASIGYTTIKRQELQELPLASYSPLFNYSSAQRVSYFGNDFTNTFLAEPMITYKIKVGGGTVSALAGMSFQNNNYQLNTITGRDFSSDDLMGNIASAGTLTNNSTIYSQYHYVSGYARLNYNLEDKYFINLTARRDGSSRFGPGKQFANFGAVGTGWIFSDEKFVRNNLPFLSFGKLRASYGITGNDQIGDYQYLQLWTSNVYGTYQGTPTLAAAGSPNADFAWETNRKLEGALQLGFFRDRINIEASYYLNRSSNELLGQSLPLSTGLLTVTRNLPAEVQNTGWEFDSSFKILTGENLRWTSTINLTLPRNKLLSYPGLSTSTDAINYVLGQPLSILEAYHISVNPQTGIYVIEDKNNSGSVDNADRYITKFIGQSSYGGFQNSIKYKNIILDFLFSFAKQTGQSYQSLISVTPGRYALGGTPNQVSEVLARWQQPGDITSIQKFTTITANNTLNTNAKTYGDISIVDASYIKLRNISLSCVLPKSWVSKLKINNATLKIQGQNLFTITKYVGLDPETQSISLPPLRTIMVGLSITL